MASTYSRTQQYRDVPAMPLSTMPRRDRSASTTSGNSPILPFSYPPSSAHSSGSPSPQHPYADRREPGSPRTPDYQQYPRDPRTTLQSISVQQLPRPKRSITQTDGQDRTPPLEFQPWLLFVFLPIPPLLATIYTVTGHAMLRTEAPDPNWHSPLAATAEAAAIGGIILAIPVALLLYVLLSPNQTTAEDFFEDESQFDLGLGEKNIRRFVGFLFLATVVMCVGGMAAPLGVTCIVQINLKRNMLTASKAAMSGMVGGVVLISIFIFLGFLGCFGWVGRFKRSMAAANISNHSHHSM